MNQLLQQLKAGDIDFGAFYKATHVEWRTMAAGLFKKAEHRLEGSADLDDIFQEMVMSVPKSVAAFDPAKTSMTVKKFVVWRAHAAANDFVGYQCGAYKHRTGAPPRAPTIAACLGVRARTGAPAGRAPSDSVDNGTVEAMSVVDADQEWCVDVRAVRRAVCRTMVEHVVMDRMLTVGASLRDITDSIYQDIELRQKLELSSQKKTYGLVRRVTTRFADRAAGMA